MVSDVSLRIDVRSREKEIVCCADAEKSGEASLELACQGANNEYRSPQTPFPSELLPGPSSYRIHSEIVYSFKVLLLKLLWNVCLCGSKLSSHDI